MTNNLFFHGGRVVPIPFAKLSRWPESEAANLFAVDATDRMLLRLSQDRMSSAPPDTVATVFDHFGALTLSAAASGAGPVRCVQDSLTARQATENNLHIISESIPDAAAVRFLNLDPSAFSGVRTVIMQLPKDNRLLDMTARMISATADPEVQIFAGGRIKYMNHGMNEILGRHFRKVDVSLAQQKSRVLIAAGTRDSAPFTLPYSTHSDPDLEFSFCSLPGTFSSDKLDIGTRFLLSTLRGWWYLPHATRAADLGCGTGIIATWLLSTYPHLHVLATDVSHLATLSTLATIRNGVPTATEGNGPGQFQVLQDVGLSSIPRSSLDLVITNPPFHHGGRVDTLMARRLFDDAASALAPGGHCVTVFNSHLPHREALERAIGPTVQLARNAKFTITDSVRRAEGFARESQ